jgi:glycerol-3-phosphate acyltransferase PlsY
MLALMSLAAVLGHVFTPWLKFQGGKGVATALGVILAADATMILLPMGTFLFALWLTRHVSLGSILAAAMVPVQLVLAHGAHRPVEALLGRGPAPVLPWAALALLVIWKHRENILRLQAGTESKLWGAKKEDAHV